MTDNELIHKALGIARTLSYNDRIQGQAKHIILELAHRLDRKQRKHNALVRWLVDVCHKAWTHNPRRKGT